VYEVKTDINEQITILSENEIQINSEVLSSTLLQRLSQFQKISEIVNFTKGGIVESSAVGMIMEFFETEMKQNVDSLSTLIVSSI